jgi:hypothetical protein
MAGLFFTSPWVFLFIIPLARLIYALVIKKHNVSLSSLELWCFIVIGGSSAIMLTLLLLFYYPATRYIEDFTPLFFLLTFLLLAKDFTLVKDFSLSRFYSSLILVFGSWSIMASLLLALPVEHVVKIIKISKQIHNWILGINFNG